MTLEEVTALDALARKRFTYRVNNVMAWRSYADDVLVGKWWQGDCSTYLAAMPARSPIVTGF